MTHDTLTNTTNAPTGGRDGLPAPTDTQSPCCGGPAAAGTDACCIRDADVKSAGGTGCGCGSTSQAPEKKRSGCCA